MTMTESLVAKRFALRIQPVPSIVLEYVESGKSRVRTIKLMDLSSDSDVDKLAAKVRQRGCGVARSLNERFDTWLLLLHTSVPRPTGAREPPQEARSHESAESSQGHGHRAPCTPQRGTANRYCDCGTSGAFPEPRNHHPGPTQACIAGTVEEGTGPAEVDDEAAFLDADLNIVSPSRLSAAKACTAALACSPL